MTTMIVNKKPSTDLWNALEACGIDPRAILAGDIDGLREFLEQVQSIMDAINEHHGIPRMRSIQLIANKVTPNSTQHMVVKAKPETVVAIRNVMENMTLVS